MKKKAKIKSNLELSKQIRGVWGINPVTRIHDKEKKAGIKKQRHNSKELCRQELYSRRPNEVKKGSSIFLRGRFSKISKSNSKFNVAIFYN
jgi:hypothetical protein